MRSTKLIGAALLVLLMTATGLAHQPDERPAATTVVEVPALPRMDTTRMPVAKVLGVDSSDTVQLDLGGKPRRVQLAAVDAPGAGKDGEHYGDEAQTFLRNLLAGESVRVSWTDEQKGRAILYREPDGMLVNAEIVRQGYGRTEADGSDLAAALRALQDRARLARKGMWAPALKPAAPIQPEPVPPAPATTQTPPAKLVTPLPEVPKAPDEASITVFATRSGTKYHRAGCSYTSKSGYSLSLKDAKAKGLTPCSRCNPPN